MEFLLSAVAIINSFCIKESGFLFSANVATLLIGINHDVYELVDAKCITSLDENPSYVVFPTSSQIKSVATSAKSQQVKSELKRSTGMLYICTSWNHLIR